MVVNKDPHQSEDPLAAIKRSFARSDELQLPAPGLFARPLLAAGVSPASRFALVTTFLGGPTSTALDTEDCEVTMDSDISSDEELTGVEIEVRKNNAAVCGLNQEIAQLKARLAAAQVFPNTAHVDNGYS